MTSPHETPRGAALPLRISIASWMLGDGSPPPPVVGEVGEYVLSFREESEYDAADAAVSELAGTAVPDGPPHLSGRGDRRMRWPTRLRGLGWDVFWAASRPVTGPTRVRGSLSCDYAFRSTRIPVRGRILRVQLESVLMRLNAERDRYELIPGTHEYRDVETCPQWLNDVASGDEVRREWAAVVDLDLADAPPAQPRPRLCPAAVTVDGDIAWLIDRELPVVVRLDLATGACREHLLPGPVTERNDYEIPTVWAAGGTCWAFRPDGVFRIDGAAIERLSERPVNTVVRGIGRALIALHEARNTVRIHVIHTGDGDLGEPLHIGDAPGWGVATAGGFLLLTCNGEMHPEDRTYRLVRVDDDGEITVGPVLDEVGPNPDGFGGIPPRIHTGGLEGRPTALDVNPDLTVAPFPGRPGGLWATRTVDGALFGVRHPPDGTGPGGWWPLDGPCPYVSEEQFWLLVRLDPETLEPVAVAPLHATQPNLAFHGSDVLVATGTGLHRWSGTGYSELVDIPVTGLLDPGQ